MYSFFLFSSWLLFRIHSYFLILFLFYFLLSFCLGVSLYRIKRKKQKKILSRSDFFQSFLVESFQNVDTIKGLHLEYDFLNQLKTISFLSYSKLSIKSNFIVRGKWQTDSLLSDVTYFLWDGCLFFNSRHFFDCSIFYLSVYFSVFIGLW